MMRQAWVDKDDEVAVVQQCMLVGVSRATVYARQRPRPADESDLLLSRLIDEEYGWVLLSVLARIFTVLPRHCRQARW